MFSLTRQNSFRQIIVVVLIALLFAGLFLCAGHLPALLAATFVFLFLLSFSNCPPSYATAAGWGDHVRDPGPARAPPTSPF